MVATATDIVNLDRMKLALGITDDDAELEARILTCIEGAVGRVEDLVGYPLTRRTVDVTIPAPVVETEVLNVDLPDFVQWTAAQYRTGEDVYTAPTQRTWNMVAATTEPARSTALQGYVETQGYPPTHCIGKWSRSQRPRFLRVHPNGLVDGTTPTKEWPDFAEGSELILTARTEMVEVPKGLEAAVELYARDLYDGRDTVAGTDAVMALCKPHVAFGRPQVIRG